MTMQVCIENLNWRISHWLHLWNGSVNILSEVLEALIICTLNIEHHKTHQFCYTVLFYIQNRFIWIADSPDIFTYYNVTDVLQNKRTSVNDTSIFHVCKVWIEKISPVTGNILWVLWGSIKLSPKNSFPRTRFPIKTEHLCEGNSFFS